MALQVTVPLALAGQRFGRLTVLARGPSTANGQSTWRCICECGKTSPAVVGSNLRAGKSQSCGCLGIEARAAATAISNRKHGETHSPLWTVWYSMRQRCRDPNHKSFADYGGRGIRVCERWKSFEAFRDDMGERPVGTQIDRIDNAKGYEPGNCRWSTAREQNRNRRSNVPVTAFGETKLIVEWTEDPRCPVSAGTFAKRLESGWSAERAMSQPLRGVDA